MRIARLIPALVTGAFLVTASMATPAGADTGATAKSEPLTPWEILWTDIREIDRLVNGWANQSMAPAIGDSPKSDEELERIFRELGLPPLEQNNATKTHKGPKNRS